MDALWTGLPPVTRGWNIAIVATATLITLNKVKSSNLLFVPDKAFSNQNWRLVSSFFTFGELSMNLFMEFWFVSNSCRRVEDSFTISILPKVVDSFNPQQRKLLQELIERNKSIDFLYYLIQISMSIVIAATFGYYKLRVNLLELGNVLCHLLIYIDSKHSPEELMNLFGIFQFKNVYFPWICACLHWLVLTVNLLDVNWKFSFEIVAKPLIWFYTVAYGLGHLWWVTKDFLLQKVHNDEEDARRILRSDTLKQFKVFKLDLVKEFLLMAFLPPWYWIIISKIQRG
ncbi:Derlin-2 [Spathaspora sp. JA1]|nr:Derlin-2 [Spathaspora sp. JA1]